MLIECRARLLVPFLQTHGESLSENEATTQENRTEESDSWHEISLDYLNPAEPEVSGSSRLFSYMSQ